MIEDRRNWGVKGVWYYPSKYPWTGIFRLKIDVLNPLRASNVLKRKKVDKMTVISSPYWVHWLLLGHFSTFIWTIHWLFIYVGSCGWDEGKARLMVTNKFREIIKLREKFEISKWRHEKCFWTRIFCFSEQYILCRD